MDIVKNLWDADLTDDQAFFAAILSEEFGCASRVEQIKNKTFISNYAQPLNDFTIYTTAQPNIEGVRMISMNR